MFQAGLLLIIRRYLSEYTVVGMCHALCWLSGVPRNFFRGGVQQIQLRIEDGDLGAVAP